MNNDSIRQKWKQLIFEELDNIAKKHPYKVIGNMDSYSQYNEAWQDCIDCVEHMINEVLISKYDEIFKKWEPKYKKWIPFYKKNCDGTKMLNDLLPSNWQTILISYKNIVFIDNFITDGINFCLNKYPGLDLSKCAWKPLPEPWEGEKLEK